MKNLLKNMFRVIAAFAVCSTLNACAQPASMASSGFPTYGSQASVGSQYEPLSIMDY